MLKLCQHATYSIDNDNNVIVGLPPVREGWVTARSYCLEESLADRALHVRLTPTCFNYVQNSFVVVSDRAHERRRSRLTSGIASDFDISQRWYRITAFLAP